MPVSPQDFELYSRVTGNPMPSDAMSRMQMAPEVYKFTKDFAKRPNLLEKTGNAFKAVGEIGLRGLGEGYKSSQANEQRRMRVMEDELKQEKAMEMMEFQANLPQKEQELTNTERNQAAMRETAILRDQLADKKYQREQGLGNYENTTTSDNFNQDVSNTQTSDYQIEDAMDQGTQMTDTKTIAGVLAGSQDSQPPLLESSDPFAKSVSEKADVFRQSLQEKNPLLAALVAERFGGETGGAKLPDSEGESFLVDDFTKEVDVRDLAPERYGHPDITGDGGGNMENVPGVGQLDNQLSGQNGVSTSSTVNLSPKSKQREFADEMRKMDAQERIAERRESTPSEKQVELNLLQQRAKDNEDALASGFMNMTDEQRRKESIRLGSTGGIPNKTDMEEIRKDPEYIAAQNSMKPSTLEKAEQFIAISPSATVMTPEKSSFVKSVSLNPPSGDNPNMISFDLGNPEKRSQFIMSDPMAVSMGMMADDGSLANESLGKIFNMALDDVDENRKARKAGQKYRGLFRPVDGQ